MRVYFVKVRRRWYRVRVPRWVARALRVVGVCVLSERAGETIGRILPAVLRRGEL